MTGRTPAPAPVPAVGVVDLVLAAGNRSRYVASMQALARRHRFQLERVVELGPREGRIERQVFAALPATADTAVIVPSLRHLRGVERSITDRVDLYVVRPARIYRRGHRWNATP